MNMNKNAWSRVLLCITVIFFVLIMLISVETGISLYELQNIEASSKNDIIDSAFAAFLIWTGFIIYGGAFAFSGALCSLMSNKIATNPIIKRITRYFLFLYSAILLLIMGLVIYFVISTI